MKHFKKMRGMTEKNSEEEERKKERVTERESGMSYVSAR